jgi:hypothetical protein
MDKQQLFSLVQRYLSILSTREEIPLVLSNNFVFVFEQQQFNNIDGVDEWLQSDFFTTISQEFFDLVSLKIKCPSTQLVNCKCKVLFTGYKGDKRFCTVLKMIVSVDVVNQNIYKVLIKSYKVLDGKNPFF